jgi:hypothetical protein
VAESLAGSFAKVASVVVKAFAFAQKLKESGGMAGGVGAARFTVNQEQAQCAGPECCTRHVDFLLVQTGKVIARGNQIRKPARKVCKIRLRIRQVNR